MRNVWALLAIIGVGCGSSVNVNNELPKGTVGGLVVDAAGEGALSGATVKIVTATATLTATTGADGFYRIDAVPVGSFIITIAQMGYQTAQFTRSLDGAVGNFPVTNPSLTIGPTGLVKNDGTFTVRVLDQIGAPAKDIRLVARTQVRQVDFSQGRASSSGSFTVEAKSGADGLATFMGLPNYALLGGVVDTTLFVDIAPVKVMGSEVYSFLGLSTFFDQGTINSGTPTIVLAGPRTGLAVLESNIENLRTIGNGFGSAAQGSIIGAMGPITIAFNQAIRQDTVRAQFTTEDGKLTNAITAMVNVSTNFMTITPSQAMPAGARMNLLLRVDAAQSAASNDGVVREVNSIAPFFVAQASGVNVAVVTSGDAPKIDPAFPAQTVVFNFNEPIGLGRASGIAALPCVAFYEGVDFDNSPTLFPGEYGNNSGSDVPRLLCTHPMQPALNVTSIIPVDTNTLPGAPVTGFYTRWRIQYDAPPTGGCSTALGTTACTKPLAGTTRVHLVFSLANGKDPNSAVRRANGQPVDDKITFLLPN